VELQLSSGERAQYLCWAKVRFDVEGERVELTVFRDPQSGETFVPFRDETARSGETYAGALFRGSPHRRGNAAARLQLRIQPILRLQRRLGLSATSAENISMCGSRQGEKAFSAEAGHEV
jgi:uncharacterized protein (DUF1684 family)